MLRNKKPRKRVKRVVLGEGYPWAMGTGPYHELQLHEENIVSKRIPLDFPKEWWQKSVPRIRLVAEVIE